MGGVKLADAWIHGLRRFGGPDPHRVRFDAKLVCLIGANEAGKSTVLDALNMSYGGEPVPQTDRTRRETIPDDRAIVRLKYRLDQPDRDALADIPCDGDPQLVRWFHVSRAAGGGLTSRIEPTLKRDLEPRALMHAQLEAQATAWWPDLGGDENAATDEDEAAEPAFAPDRERAGRLIEALGQDVQTLSPEVITDLNALAEELEGQLPDLAEAIRELAVAEDGQPPDRVAAERLWSRRPMFVRFDDEARILDSEHDLADASTAPGTALGNLVRLARLPVDQLVNAVRSGETGTVIDLINDANATLAARFAAWQQQPPVQVVLDTEGTVLRIHVQSGSGPTMQLRERSDGLRQFVALVALTAQEQYTVPPILLIDEVETHLHYNAQADLIDVLTTQTAASQVVYTTHSAACLPQDLGLGVRVVEGIGETTASTVRQNFWQDRHPGLGALLMGLGASSLVYVTLRPAVIAEGGSDLILLPTLIREATEQDSLGFAIVPGASGTPPDRIAGLDLTGVRTAWVLDADDAGRKRREELIEARVDDARILLLAVDGDLEIEDLIHPDVYVEAVRDYLRDIGAPEELTVEDLPEAPCARPETVDAWCTARGLNPPGKIAVANKLIDLVGERRLLDPSRFDAVVALHERIAGVLNRRDARPAEHE